MLAFRLKMPMNKDLTFEWADLIFERHIRPASCILGVLKGEGIGPEVMSEALKVLSAVREVSTCKIEISVGGPIGLEAESQCGKPLPDETRKYCADIFSRGGAILAGPGGGRFVYDLRRNFDLFCKINPLKPINEVSGAARIKQERLSNTDIVIVRDNSSGVYQGTESVELDGEKRVKGLYEHREVDVRRIITVAARVAARRSGKMMVVLKDGGLPQFSNLWRECADKIAEQYRVECSFANVDFAAYLLIQQAQELDVIVTSNLFGDILADLGGVLLGSRGMCYSGNFSASSAAVYQTNHGAAYDLAGKDIANPIGQILSLAMLLRESFGLVRESDIVASAIRNVLREGWRTSDISETGCRLAGTREMGDLISDAVVRNNRRVGILSN